MIKPRALHKLPECDRCLLYSNEPFLVCAVHPTGPQGDSCMDFRPDPDLESKQFVDFLGLQTGDEMTIENSYSLDSEEAQWEPEAASYYNGELILQPQQRWTQEEMLDLLDHHPIFTGRCPRCLRSFPQYERPPVHWDCECGWMDDTI